MEHNTRVIAVANQKGGVAKTTSAINIAAAMQEQGLRVVLLDFDPQSSLSKYLDYARDDKPVINDFIAAFASGNPLPDTTDVIRTAACGLEYIPSSIGLSKVELMLFAAMSREMTLRNVLPAIIPADTYDFVIVDCNPSMGLLLTNVLAAADYLLIPVKTEMSSVEGLEDMLQLATQIQRVLNPDLKIAGLLPTMLGSKGGENVVSYLSANYPEYTMQHNTSLNQYANQNWIRHRPVVGQKNALGEQYRAITTELVDRIGRMEAN